MDWVWVAPRGLGGVLQCVKGDVVGCGRGGMCKGLEVVFLALSLPVGAGGGGGGEAGGGRFERGLREGVVKGGLGRVACVVDESRGGRGTGQEKCQHEMGRVLRSASLLGLQGGVVEVNVVFFLALGCSTAAKVRIVGVRIDTEDVDRGTGKWKGGNMEGEEGGRVLTYLLG